MEGVAPSEQRRQRREQLLEDIGKVSDDLTKAVATLQLAMAEAPPEAAMELADANINVHHAAGRLSNALAVIVRGGGNV